jgi:RecB family exonuclease
LNRSNVAFSRARDRLILTSAADCGGARKKKLSRFLLEAGLATDPHQESSAQSTRPANLPSPPAAIDETIELPKTFSFTQIHAFATCPYQYRFAHLLKIPVPGRFTFSYGKTMHSTLHKFFQQIQEIKAHAQGDLFGRDRAGAAASPTIPSLENLLQIYDESWIEDWYEDKKQKEEYRKRGREALKAFYLLHRGEFPTPLFLEKGFTISIDGIRVRGVVDRVDPITKSDQHGVRIIDYKTGRAPTSERDFNLDQLLLYAIAARDVFGKEPLILTFYYLDENHAFDFDVDEKKIARVREKIIKIVDEISKSNFQATPGYHCMSCDYYEICPFRQARR